MGYRLSDGSALRAGEMLISPNRAYRLVMQGDGNLVEYQAGTALWASNTGGDNGAVVEMQSDGNLVIYLNGAAKWASNTGGFQGAQLVLQDDSNLVMYGKQSAILWSRHYGAYPRLMLPFASDSSWYVVGTHTDNACGTGCEPKNALDISGGNGHVLAAGAGTVHLLCGGTFVVIDHGNGWHTGYYHMQSIQVTDGQHVNAGTYLGNTGTATPCGGSAYGNHVHFTLWHYSGSPSYPVGPTGWAGIDLGGWVFHDDSQARDCDIAADPCGSAIRYSDGVTTTLPTSLTNYGVP
jgi:LasA protease